MTDSTDPRDQAVPVHFHRGAPQDAHQARRHRAILGAMKGLAGAVLDYGCGWGDITFAISRTHPDVRGVDVDPQRVAFAAAQYPEKAAAIRRALGQILQAEADRAGYSETPANAFGDLMAELFTVRDDRWTDGLRRFARSLGKLIYFMDAACDLQADRKKGQYNPLLLLGIGSGAEFAPQLRLLAGDAAEEFERLPIVQDAELLQNILYSGVWTRFEAAFRPQQEEQA